MSPAVLRAGSQFLTRVTRGHAAGHAERSVNARTIGGCLAMPGLALHRSLCTASRGSQNREEMTPLASFLTRQILFSGPIPVSQYMHLCLTHPEHGYYTSRDSVLGTKGDFVTAPEVSQVFGEMIAIWVANVASQMETPHGFAIAELGPGRGTLMSDMLRSLRALGSLPKQVHFVEASTIMRNAQKQAVGSIALRHGIDLKWHSSLQSVPDHGLRDGDTAALPTIYVAQEFFDALPVHVFQSTAEGKWRERFVDVVREDDAESEPTPYHFRYVLSPGWSPATAVYASRYLPPLRKADGKPADDVSVVELCPDGITVAEQLSQRVSQSGGAALIVDYGADESRGDDQRSATLRAIKSHNLADVRSLPGQCDITADVNFGHVKRAVDGSEAQFHGSTTQGDFLLRLGAAMRFRSLGMAIVDDKALSDEEKDKRLLSLQGDHDRLVSPSEMGSLYRVCSVASRSITPPALR